MSASVVEWISLVGLVFVVATFLPGYLVMRLLDSKAGKGDIGQIIVYSTGIGLLVMPLATYWANFFGLPINELGTVVLLLAVLGIASVIQMALRLTAKGKASPGILR